MRSWQSDIASVDVEASHKTASTAAMSGVWVGSGTVDALRQPPPQRTQIRSAGAGKSCALHMIVRLCDAEGLLCASRTYFLSNGRVPHHWQHRVFSDGEVFDPVVEDEVHLAARSYALCRIRRRATLSTALI